VGTLAGWKKVLIELTLKLHPLWASLFALRPHKTTQQGGKAGGLLILWKVKREIVLAARMQMIIGINR
jgi:hypothetical protein